MAEQGPIEGEGLGKIIDTAGSQLPRKTLGAKVRKLLIVFFWLFVVIGVPYSLISPAVFQAMAAAERTQIRNDLKQIGVAMHQYEAEHGQLPDTYIKDEGGYPLLSWRVRLLPYMDEQELYEQFKLDEPWFSTHNRKLISQMPDVYQSPHLEKDEHKTPYLLPVADGTLFSRGKGVKLSEIIDGESNTIMVVEASDDQTVVWTKPEDLTIDLESPQEMVSSERGLCLTLMADGSVQVFGKSISTKILVALLTFAGQEDLTFGESFGI